MEHTNPNPMVLTSYSLVTNRNSHKPILNSPNVFSLEPRKGIRGTQEWECMKVEEDASIYWHDRISKTPSHALNRERNIQPVDGMLLSIQRKGPSVFFISIYHSI